MDALLAFADALTPLIALAECESIALGLALPAKALSAADRCARRAARAQRAVAVDWSPVTATTGGDTSSSSSSSSGRHPKKPRLEQASSSSSSSSSSQSASETAPLVEDEAALEKALATFSTAAREVCAHWSSASACKQLGPCDAEASGAPCFAMLPATRVPEPHRSWIRSAKLAAENHAACETQGTGGESLNERRQLEAEQGISRPYRPPGAGRRPFAIVCEFFLAVGNFESG